MTSPRRSKPADPSRLWWRSHPLRAVAAVGSASMLAGSVLFLAGSAALATSHHANGKGGPGGNNGTIKIDKTLLVDSKKVDHANHPHVTCTFALSFFGYDTGTDSVQVSFTAQPPSGKFTSVQTTQGPGSFNFTVANRTGGSQLDSSNTYALDVSGLKQQPQQGYHIKVTVDVTSSLGSDEKYKVFWYRPCSSGGGGSTTTTTTTTLPTTTTTTLPTTTPTTLPPTTTTTVPGSGTTGGSTGGSTDGTGPGSGPVTGVQSSSAANAAGPLPLGAGTDLGRFAPLSKRSPVAPWSLLLGGIALLLGLAVSTRSVLARRRV